MDYNVASVENLGGGAWRVNFITPINEDETITLPDGQVVNPGDFAGIVTPLRDQWPHGDCVNH